jgi:uncharacterized membrane protein
MHEQIEAQMRQALVTSLLVLCSLLFLDTSWWKATIIAALTLLAGGANLGTGWLARGALVLFVVATLIWLDFLPPLAELKKIALASSECSGDPSPTGAIASPAD